MNNSIATTRLFHPLSGLELSEILQDAFKTSLAGSTLLQPHLTFPKVIYKLELTLESYPMSAPEEFRIEKTLEVQGMAVGEPLHEKIVISRELGETQETAPDALREAVSLPVPQTIQDPKTGFHTDAPIAEPRKATVGQGTVPRGRATRVTVGKAADDDHFPGDPIDVVPNTHA